uniref:Holliday junction resolvase RecU n=1 Tax=Roseburia inulinivorans TaxID=360807 RepID=UPI004038B00A
MQDHQVVVKDTFEKPMAIAFFLISFTARDELYYLRFAKLLYFWNRAKEGR